MRFFKIISIIWTFIMLIVYMITSLKAKNHEKGSFVFVIIMNMITLATLLNL